MIQSDSQLRQRRLWYLDVLCTRRYPLFHLMQHSERETIIREKKNNGKEERDMARVMECVEAIAEMDSEEVLGSSDQQSLREG